MNSESFGIFTHTHTNTHTHSSDLLQTRRTSGCGTLAPHCTHTHTRTLSALTHFRRDGLLAAGGVEAEPDPTRRVRRGAARDGGEAGRGAAPAEPRQHDGRRHRAAQPRARDHQVSQYGIRVRQCETRSVSVRPGSVSVRPASV